MLHVHVCIWQLVIQDCGYYTQFTVGMLNSVYPTTEGRIYYGLTIESDVPKSIVGLASVTPDDGVITGKVITRTDSEKMVADGEYVSLV